MHARDSLLLAALILAVVPHGANAQISDGVVKIGVLTDLSGPASDATGQGSVVAAQMAVEDFGGKIAGKSIEVISANHQVKPDIGAEIARRWYDVDKVDLILDVPRLHREVLLALRYSMGFRYVRARYRHSA